MSEFSCIWMQLYLRCPETSVFLRPALVVIVKSETHTHCIDHSAGLCWLSKFPFLISFQHWTLCTSEVTDLDMTGYWISVQKFHTEVT
jgi:hypothetical protein